MGGARREVTAWPRCWAWNWCSGEGDLPPAVRVADLRPAPGGWGDELGANQAIGPEKNRWPEIYPNIPVRDVSGRLGATKTFQKAQKNECFCMPA